jgi:hypothetical protein
MAPTGTTGTRVPDGVLELHIDPVVGQRRFMLSEFTSWRGRQGRTTTRRRNTAGTCHPSWSTLIVSQLTSYQYRSAAAPTPHVTRTLHSGRDGLRPMPVCGDWRLTVNGSFDSSAVPKPRLHTRRSPFVTVGSTIRRNGKAHSRTHSLHCTSQRSEAKWYRGIPKREPCHTGSSKATTAAQQQSIGPRQSVYFVVAPCC